MWKVIFNSWSRLKRGAKSCRVMIGSKKNKVENIEKIWKYGTNGTLRNILVEMELGIRR